MTNEEHAQELLDAKATVEYAIFDAISSNFDKNPFIIRDKVFEKLFEPHLIWAIKKCIEQHGKDT